MAETVHKAIFAHSIMKENISEIKELLTYPKQVAIISHRNPDGDALGSALALKLFLDQKGHMVKVVMPSEYPSGFGYLPEIDNVIISDEEPDIATKAFQDAQIIFCLDFNSLDRIDKMGKVIHETSCTKLLIDHHLDPEPFADYMLTDTDASSTCELVYEFIHMLGEESRIGPRIGDCLLTGIITDTGSFKYNTRPNTYRVSASLKEAGVDDYRLQDKIYNCLQEKQLRLLGHCLANRMELLPEYRTGIIHLTKEDYKTFDIRRGDTEGIVNYMLMMRHIDVAAFITEQPTIVKISLRSKGDISVQEIARNHFNGGGHKNASGGSAYAKLEDILTKFKNVIPRYVKKQA